MDIKIKYKSDIDFIKSKEGHLGGEFWTTEDNRIGKGSPFSARDVAIMLTELGFTQDDGEIKGLAKKMFSALKPDGRFRISPGSTIFPCHTITILRVLHYMGYSLDTRLEKTYAHLFEIQNNDGGWRCNRIKMGSSLNTDSSNPGVTLEALDAFRFTKFLNNDKRLDKAVDFLLKHWEIKKPLGPCSFGIGTLFMQTEFPFLRYNLFYYCYTLSFYSYATNDDRFIKAVRLLDQKVKAEKLIIENPNRRLANLSFCRKGKSSDLATIRYRELKNRIIKNAYS